MATLSESSGSVKPVTTQEELRSEAAVTRDGARSGRETGRLRRGESIFGWFFVSPAVAILVIFTVIPIFLALYVSFTNWSGLTSPFSHSVQLVGLTNYRTLMTTPGLYQTDFATSIRDNLYFFVIVVPLQTALALWLATLVNNKYLRGKGFFRTAFYFPSVTSSIAITMVFIFLFQGDGVVNTVLGWVGVKGPNWVYDQSGLFTNILNALGVHDAGWANHQFIGLSLWDWIAGPSVGMCVIIILLIWTTSGTFMLFFLASMQGIGEDVDEATAVDGATPWERFRFVTLPLLRPALALVVTLGFISTWQVFDQITLTALANPTTITPAYFAYQVSFLDSAFGQGAAVAFLLFCLIIFLTAVQRRFIKEDLTT